MTLIDKQLMEYQDKKSASFVSLCDIKPSVVKKIDEINDFRGEKTLGRTPLFK